MFRIITHDTCLGIHSLCDSLKMLGCVTYHKPYISKGVIFDSPCLPAARKTVYLEGSKALAYLGRSAHTKSAVALEMAFGNLATDANFQWLFHDIESELGGASRRGGPITALSMFFVT